MYLTVNCTTVHWHILAAILRMFWLYNYNDEWRLHHQTTKVLQLLNATWKVYVRTKCKMNRLRWLPWCSCLWSVERSRQDLQVLTDIHCSMQPAARALQRGLHHQSSSEHQTHIALSFNRFPNWYISHSVITYLHLHQVNKHRLQQSYMISEQFLSTCIEVHC